jgi:hypothetical protein
MDKFDTDMNRVFADPGGVNVNALDRLRFAKQVLLGLGVICSGVFVAHGLQPDHPGVSQIFELVKIGALPLVTLVISFYFPNSSTK